MKIYDNMITARREYYSGKGEYMGHMCAELLVMRVKLNIQRKDWPDGFNMRPWGYFNDHPENNKTK